MEDEDSVNAISCKVVLLGESGVGKTSIISRYINNTFSSVLISTSGANFATKTTYIDETKQYINFEIWDTAGQEKFRSLAKIFYKNAAILILVYDITRRESFNQLKEFWIKEIQANVSSSSGNNKLIFAVAGNKCDCYDIEEVKEKEGQAFAKEINGIFKTTSAKMSNGIDDLFKMIGQKFVNPEFQDTSHMTNEEKKEFQNKQSIKKLENGKRNNANKGGCCKGH